MVWRSGSVNRDIMSDIKIFILIFILIFMYIYTSISSWLLMIIYSYTVLISLCSHSLSTSYRSLQITIFPSIGGGFILYSLVVNALIKELSELG